MKANVPFDRPLQVGMVIQLVSGGTAMTIEHVADSGVCCVWTDRDGKLRRDTLPAEALKSCKAGVDGTIKTFGSGATPEEVEEYRRQVVLPLRRRRNA